MNHCITGLLVLAASFLLTGVLRRYALKRSLMDVPNARSSHTVPTPRGGGVAIVCAYLAALAALVLQGGVAGSAFIALAGAGLLVAVLGFMDDHGHIAARWRLLGHFCAGAWVLYFVGGMPVVQFAGLRLDAGWLMGVAGLLYLVWMLNLYNFMDGIDGIAGVQAVTVCLGICLVYWLDGHVELAWSPLMLAAAAAGFLLWNFPPAKIFMGDAGSGFLGLVLAALSLQGAHVEPGYLWAWLILMGVFIVDATFTLARRLARGEKVYEAHRSHAYQYASRHFRGHRPVTLAVALINVLWLLPMALAVTWLHLDGLAGLLLAYMPLVGLAWKYHAGVRETMNPAV